MTDDDAGEAWISHRRVVPLGDQPRQESYVEDTGYNGGRLPESGMSRST